MIDSSQTMNPVEGFIYLHLCKLESVMGYSKKNIEFAHSPIGVCSLIMWVEAISAAGAIGIFAWVYYSEGLQGADVSRGAITLLSLLLAGCGAMLYCALRHRNSITLGESQVNLKTLSGIREILYFDDIESVKSNRENVFIRMKDERVVALLADDFRDLEMLRLFVEELRKHISVISIETKNALAEVKPRWEWESGKKAGDKDAA